MVHGLSSVKLEAFFEVDYGSRTCGHDWKLKKKSYIMNILLHFFSERVINWWNSLENSAVCASMVTSTKELFLMIPMHMMNRELIPGR